MSENRGARIADLIAVMARLRDPENGCPWDLQQDFSTIAPYTLEEAYEVMDAIERNDAGSIRDELGDLLFQVVFHARMAEEKGWFDFDSVAGAIVDKLVRRHPHVFGDGKHEDWESLKATERAAKDASTLADIPRALPALTRAAKIGKRASRIGFDWPSLPGVRAKISEELVELDAEVARDPASPETEEEYGDLLFALVNLGRHLKIDPEASLRGANAKFEQRFRRMEALAASRNLRLSSLTEQEWEGLWLEAKRTSISV
jgi:ATP diphosphatase